MVMRVDVTTIPKLAALAGSLSRFAGEIRSMKDPLEEAVDEVIRPRIRENFSSESAAGIGWAPLSETTIQDRLNRGYDSGPILQRSGALAQAAQQKNIWKFSGQAGEAFVTELPQNAWYGIIHDQGLLEPKVPARPFFAINADDMDEIEEIFGRWVARSFDKTVIGGGTLGGLIG